MSSAISDNLDTFYSFSFQEVVASGTFHDGISISFSDQCINGTSGNGDTNTLVTQPSQCKKAVAPLKDLSCFPKCPRVWWTSCLCSIHTPACPVPGIRMEMEAGLSFYSVFLSRKTKSLHNERVGF